MIDVNDIAKIIEDSKTMSHDVKVKDIAYLCLLKFFKDKSVAYTALYGKDFSDNDLERYDRSDRMKFLSKYLESNYKDNDQKRKKNKGDKFKDLTFEENKEAMIELLNEIQDAKKDGKIKVSEALKAEADIRTRLNDKFAVSEKQDEQRVVVENKYNAICPYCRHEMRVPTKEDVRTELEKEYKLIPRENERKNETDD